MASVAPVGVAWILALTVLAVAADGRPTTRSSCLRRNRLFSAHLVARVVKGAPHRRLAFARCEILVTLSLYSLITVVAAASLTHAFALSGLPVQPHASGDCQKINQPRRPPAKRSRA